MNACDIKVNSFYVNKSGRMERKVLDCGPHVKVRWFGVPKNEPVGEDGVLFELVRAGNTYYGEGSGKRPQIVYLSTFALWADREVLSK